MLVPVFTAYCLSRIIDSQFIFVTGYIHADGGSSTKGGGGGGGLIAISYTSGYVTGEITAYGGSGRHEYGAAGVTYIKNGVITRKVNSF